MKEQKPKIRYYKSGNIQSETWTIPNKYNSDGLLHRIDKPALIWYSDEGHVIREYWSVEGKQHRDNGLPAYVSYYKSGQVLHETWCIDGKMDRNRAEGFFDINYNEDGTQKPVDSSFTLSFVIVFFLVIYVLLCK